jgi:hypothetical protein
MVTRPIRNEEASVAASRSSETGGSGALEMRRVVNASPDRDGRRSRRSQCAYHQHRRKRREAATNRQRAHARHSAEHSAHSDAAETSDGTRSAPLSSLSHRLDPRHDTELQYPACGSRASAL